MKKIIFCCISLIVLSGCTLSGKNTTYPQLTACMTEKKVVMFGASWCSACAEQKQLFKKSLRAIPYFECSPNRTQVKECDDRGITSYPTWQFDENTLKSLPDEPLLALVTHESTKVKGSITSIRKALKEPDESITKVLDEYDAKVVTLLASDVSEFEKLTQLQSLHAGPDGKSIVQKPVYISGRMSGVLSLSEIALYSGCSDAYEADMGTQTPSTK